MKTYTIKDCKEKAREKGGRCLSVTYVNARQHLRWQCQKGHRWSTAWHHIQNGQWCCKCSMKEAGLQKRDGIEKMQKMAKINGGRLVSKISLTSGEKLEWECRNKHHFFASPNSVQQGNWCRKCSRNEYSNKMANLLFQKVKAVASSHSGVVNRVEGERHQAVAACRNGHTWQSHLKALLRSKTWCRACNEELALNELQELVRGHGGKLLTGHILGSGEKYSLECKFGHSFKAALHNVRRGKWCPTCGKMRKSILATYELAKRMGGKCLSEIYEGPNYHLKIAKFQCAQGHQWNAPVALIRKCRWCPECLKDKFNRTTARQLP